MKNTFYSSNAEAYRQFLTAKKEAVHGRGPQPELEKSASSSLTSSSSYSDYKKSHSLAQQIAENNKPEGNPSEESSDPAFGTEFNPDTYINNTSNR